MTREDWLEARRTGIGGSDVAAVLGISPWLSRYELWAQKRGLLPVEDREAEYLEAGRRLEPVIVDWYKSVTNRYTATGAGMLRHPERPYLIGNVDAVARDPAPLVGDSHPWGVLECKNVSVFKGKEWLERAPLHYQVQLQAYLAVTGYQWGSFAVLIGGNTFRWYDVERDEDFIRSVLYPSCETFWKLVQDGTPPPVDGSESASWAIGQVFAKGSGEAVELPMPEAEDVLLKYLTAKAELDAVGEVAAAAENRVRALMQEATYGVVPGRGQFSLKAAKGKTKRTLRWSGGE